ncbi:MAG: tetratricopeptide repeat protein [Planctomycetes bacterium]|nr:tetratricopeptide repeat protein [Planctomycetota bacterium]
MSVSQDLPQSATRRSTWLIVFATVLVFARCLGGELVYDDHLLISRNAIIADLSRVGELFTGSYWDFLDPHTAQHVGYYRPLSMLALALTYHLGGAAPWAFHAASILLHAGAALGAYAVARRLMDSERAALWAALLFSLHPVHLESVAWISGISDPLAMCFGLFAVAGVLTSQRHELAAGWKTGALFFAALCCKESAIGLLPVALVLGRLARGDEHRTPWAAFRPMLIALLVWYGARVGVFGDLLAGFNRTTTDFGVGPARLLQLRAELLGGAAALLALPLELNLFRSFSPELPALSASFLWPAAWAALLLLGAHRAYKRGAHLLAASLLVIPAAIAPVLLRVESVGTFPLSDRFLYLAALGAALTIAHLATTRLSERASVIALSALAVGYAAQDISHASTWQDDKALFRTALEQNPRNPNVYWGMGKVLLEEFKETGSLETLAEARNTYEQGMELLAEARNSDYTIFASEDDEVQMNLGLGWCLIFAAESDEFRDFETPALVFQRIIDELDRVKEIRGEDPNAANRALALTGMGVARMGAGQVTEASEAFRRAMDVNPQCVEAHFNMGLLHLRVGRPEQAVPNLEVALTNSPRDLRYMVALGVALERAGDDARAKDLAMDALSYHPRSPGPKSILGTLAAKRRDFQEAERWLTETLRENPSNSQALFDLAKVFLATNRVADAMPLLEEVCLKMPDNFEAHYTFGALLYEAGDHLRATPSLLNAFRLRNVGKVVPELEELIHSFRSDDVNVQWAIAAIEYDRASYEESLRFANRALALERRHGPSHYLIAQILARAGELETSLEHFRSASANLPDDYQVQADAGVALSSYGLKEEARAHLERALDLLPSQELAPGHREAAEQRIREALDGIREEG